MQTSVRWFYSDNSSLLVNVEVAFVDGALKETEYKQLIALAGSEVLAEYSPRVEALLRSGNFADLGALVNRLTTVHSVRLSASGSVRIPLRLSGKAEASKLIDPTRMVSSTLELTSTDLGFHGREEAMSSIDGHLRRIFEDYQQGKTLDGKGQPIIATAATTGVGKSRLLHEVRREYQAKSYRVVVVSYSGGKFPSPHPEERFSDGTRISEAFCSRLLCMMLPGTPSDGIDFQELSSRSLVHVSGASVCTVPAFLYKWAKGSFGELARHIKCCLEAALGRTFLCGGKEGTDGRRFERFMWHYEAVRRELLQGTTVSLSEFYNFIDDIPQTWSEDREFRFPVITEIEKIGNPPRNLFSNFDTTSVCIEENVRYEPSSDKFPKYDWFTVMVAEDGTKVVKGERIKQSRGPAQEADEKVASVKFSTHGTGLSPWRKNGWLVLGPRELDRYLGPTFASARICLTDEPTKRQREED